MAKKSLDELLGGVKRFGSLEVVCETKGVYRKGNGTERHILCRCDCGVVKTYVLQNVKQGKTKSCGCAMPDAVASARETHGDSISKRTGKQAPEYRAWCNMKSRCFNANVENYPAYGGRGITVSPTWLGPGGYEAFLSDVGRRPSSGHSIDRIDVNGNYEPGNVRWATADVQAKNTRRCAQS